MEIATKEDFEKLAAAIDKGLASLTKLIAKKQKPEPTEDKEPYEFVQLKFLVKRYGMSPQTTRDLAVQWRVPIFKPNGCTLYELEVFDKHFRATKHDPLAI